MRYRILLMTAGLLFMNLAGLAQADSLQQQINDQVWKPFIQTFSNMDTEGFMAVHSKDMARVLQDNKRITDYTQYYESNKRSNEYSRKNNEKRNIGLRFIQRIAGNDKAFEIGYYKVTVTSPDGKTRNFYGKFHVLLRKENGIWKILMDADANEKTDEAVFQSAKPM
jgi:ketosteroid isomerase-like protein